MPRTLTKKANTGTKQAKIWASIRILIRFRYADLEATTEAPRRTISTYVFLLAKYGYLRREKYAVFVLQRDTGPNPPIRYKSNGLRDMNTGEIFTPEDTK